MSANVIQPTKQTFTGLADVLFKTLDELRAKQMDWRDAVTIAALAKQITNIAKVELDFASFVAANPKAPRPPLAKRLSGE